MTATSELEAPVQSELSELSAKEQLTFNEIVEHFDVDVPVSLVKDANALQHLNETLSDPDLQDEKIEKLKEVRDELLGEFMDNPQEAFMAEVMNYARLCEDRAISWVDELSHSKITEFVTASASREKPDLHFRIVEFPSGNVKVAVEVPQPAGAAGYEVAPFHISSDTAGKFAIQQRGSRRGGEKNFVMPLNTNGAAEERLKQFFLYSTEAVHLAYTRKPHVQKAAHEHAKTLLVDKKLGRESRLAG